MAEDERADRPHQIGDGEAAESRDQRLGAGSEEDPRQHGREIEVQSEVVPLDHRRQRRDDDRAPVQLRVGSFHDLRD
jgi:hypothetical protein